MKKPLLVINLSTLPRGSHCPKLSFCRVLWLAFDPYVYGITHDVFFYLTFILSIVFKLHFVFKWDVFIFIAVRSFSIRTYHRDFPGSPVVKNPPSNAGDMSSSPVLEISHMPRSNSARVPEPLRLRSRAHEPQLLKPSHLEPVLHKRSHRNEKPAHLNEE